MYALDCCRGAISLINHHIALCDSKVSDGSYDCFVGCAVGAIVDAQIKTGVLRFNTGQYQPPATFGAGRPKVVDKLKTKRVYHGYGAVSALAAEIASQFRRKDGTHREICWVRYDRPELP